MAYQAPRPSYRIPEPLPETAGLTAEGERFFTDRAISLDVVRKHNITGDGITIKFPYYVNGQLINVKTRIQDGDGKRFTLETGCELTMYGLDDCKGAEQIVIVEGEMDKLALETCGITNVLSVPNGAKAKAMPWLDDELGVIDGAHRIILAVDSDDDGRGLESETARRSGHDRCYRNRWPEGYKDANEVLIDLGEAVVRRCLSEATPFPVEGMYTLLDLEADIRERNRLGIQRGVSTDWRGLDPFYTVKLGELTVITGIPGSGKSEFITALMLNLMESQGWNFGVFTPENGPKNRYPLSLAEKILGVRATMADPVMDLFFEHYGDRIGIIAPNEGSLDDILGMARSFVFRIGINGVIIDPWNEIEHLRPEGMNETEYIGRSLSRIKSFADQYNLHIWVVAHPAKMSRDKDGAMPVPSAYDISGSANWANKPDNIIVVSRDYENEGAPVEIHVRKIRDPDVGTTGTAELLFDRATRRYRDVE